MSTFTESTPASPLQTFTPEEWEQISAAGTLRRCQPGEILFRRGEFGGSMFVIDEGEVELIFIDGTPGKALRAGQVFGELAFITGHHLRTATARAVTESHLRILDQDAVDHLFSVHPRLLLNLLRRTCGYLLASEERLIQSLRRKNHELKQTLDYLRRTREEVDYQELLANTDELTGLYNRRCLDHQLDKAIQRSQETGLPLGLILLDLDGFKSVNDTGGHSMGDELLRRVADSITQCVRSTDLPCRYGGDEFAIILPEIDRTQGRERARQLRLAIEEMPSIARGLDVTASVGGTLRHASESRQDFFVRADRALYLAKNSGRNRVEWIEPEDSSGEA